ncbi:MAG: hypothetical protein F6K42_26735 [Leptolyngbya sp. SIO1D8]|nr:hypothetical protein [Leptolyngbya sp. SIO1D8]
MQSLGCVFGACLALHIVGLVIPVKAADLLPSSRLSATPLLAQIDATETLLWFETKHYIVRVYQQQGLHLLNVYNKETGFTDQNGVLAEVIPPQSEDDDWYTYVNQVGDLQYLARVNPSGMTELEIRVMGGSPEQSEIGYNAAYSFPHLYLGQDIDSALTELEESSWVVDSTRSDGVELVRDQLALDLKFDPDTRLVTYTQLIDPRQRDTLAETRR